VPFIFRRPPDGILGREESGNSKDQDDVSRTDEQAAKYNAKLLFYQGVPDVPLAKFVDCISSSRKFRHDNHRVIDRPNNAPFYKVS